MKRMSKTCVCETKHVDNEVEMKRGCSTCVKEDVRATCKVRGDRDSKESGESIKTNKGSNS